MARDRFDRCLAEVLRHEGGLVDHPSDPGGATNMGITHAVLAQWRGRAVTAAEVRALTRAEAAAIYRARYWDAVAGDALPAGLDLAVFDFAVNSGPARAVRTVQTLCGLRPDGRPGPETIAAVRARDPATLIRALTAERRSFLRGLRIYPVFGRGWMRRVDAVERLALALAGGRVTSLPTEKDETSMPITKSMFESRTVWANVVGLIAIAASLLGFNANLIDQNAIVEAILNGVAGLSFVASTVFRVAATKRIA